MRTQAFVTVTNLVRSWFVVIMYTVPSKTVYEPRDILYLIKVLKPQNMNQNPTLCTVHRIVYSGVYTWELLYDNVTQRTGCEKTTRQLSEYDVENENNFRIHSKAFRRTTYSKSYLTVRTCFQRYVRSNYRYEIKIVFIYRIPSDELMI